MEELGREDPQLHWIALEQKLRQHHVGDVLTGAAVADLHPMPLRHQGMELLGRQVPAGRAVIETAIGVLLDPQGFTGWRDAPRRGCARGLSWGGHGLLRLHEIGRTDLGEVIGGWGRFSLKTQSIAAPASVRRARG
jgi:hypothetical protein